MVSIRCVLRVDSHPAGWSLVQEVQEAQLDQEDSVHLHLCHPSEDKKALILCSSSSLHYEHIHVEQPEVSFTETAETLKTLVRLTVQEEEEEEEDPP